MTARRRSPPRRPARLSAVLIALGVAGLVAVLVTRFELFSSIGVLQRPAPREIPVAVVGPDSAAATLRDALNTLSGTPISAQSAVGVAQGRAKLRARTVSGVLVLGADGHHRLLLASAGGLAESDELRRTISAALATSGQRVTVTDIRPSTARDARGVASARLAAGWVVFAIIAAAVIAAGYRNRPARLARAGLRIGAMLALALLAGVTGTAVAALVFDSFDPPWPALSAFGSVLVAAVELATLALIAWLGRWGAALAVVAFGLLGVPGAVGAYPLTPLPAVVPTVIAWLPPGAGAWAVRGLIYFDGVGVSRVVDWYAVWIVLGALLVVAGTTDVE